MGLTGGQGVQAAFECAGAVPAMQAATRHAQGRVEVRSLVTKVFSLHETPEAFEWVEANKDQVIKAVVRP